MSLFCWCCYCCLGFCFGEDWKQGVDVLVQLLHLQTAAGFHSLMAVRRCVVDAVRLVFLLWQMRCEVPLCVDCLMACPKMSERQQGVVLCGAVVDAVQSYFLSCRAHRLIVDSVCLAEWVLL